MNSIYRYLTMFVLTMVICNCEGHLPILDAIISGVQKSRTDFHEATHKIFDALRPHSDISIKFESHLDFNRGQGNVNPTHQPYPVQPVNTPVYQGNGYEPPRPVSPTTIPQHPNYTPQDYNNGPNHQVDGDHTPHNHNNNYNHLDHSHVNQNNGNTNQNYDHDSNNYNKNQDYDKNGHYNEDKLKTPQVTHKPDYDMDLASIFGNKKPNQNGSNLNKFDNKNNDDKPLHVALNPKRETVESEKSKDEDEEFPIDVRFKSD